MPVDLGKKASERVRDFCSQEFQSSVGDDELRSERQDGPTGKLERMACSSRDEGGMRECICLRLRLRQGLRERSGGGSDDGKGRGRICFADEQHRRKRNGWQDK